MNSKRERIKLAFKWGIVVTLFLRFGLGGVMALVWQMVSKHVAAYNRPSLYGNLQVPLSSPWDAILTVWVRWDAVHHLNLAMRGYFDLSPGDSVFYPLYAYLVRVFALVIHDYVVSGLLVSSLAALAAFTLLYLLSEKHFGAEVAKWSVLVLSAYPTVFFLVAPFTESLFLALTLGVFLCAEERQWEVVGVLGFLASLTRGPGMLTPLALTVMVWREWKRGEIASYTQMVRIVFALLMPVVGGTAFLLWRYHAGYPSMTDTLRVYSGLEMINPVTGFIFALKQWVETPGFTNTLEIVTAFGLLFLGWWMVKQVRWTRPEWLVYTFVDMALFLSKHSLRASSLQSIARYVIVLFPIFVFLGNWLAQQKASIRFLYFSISSSMLLVLSVCYALWIFVG